MTKISRRNERKERTEGYLFVETALIFPVFLICILMVAALIPAMGTEERMIHEMEQTAEKQAKYTALAFDPSWDGRMELRRSESYGFPFSLELFQDLKLARTCEFRAFIGADADGEAMDFAQMEEAEEGGLVWVFPAYGEKYHKKTCKVICNCPGELCLTERVRGRYQPCELCDPENLPLGSTVCCFSSGEVYHRPGCGMVERRVEEITKTEAEERGYGPCSYCGG